MRSSPGPSAPLPRATIRDGSTRTWRKIRVLILARDRYVCQLCGQPAQHIDHIVPLAGCPAVFCEAR